MRSRKTVACVAAVVFVAALAMRIGPHLPGSEILPGLQGSALEYGSTFGGRFAPLDPSFIDSILGRRASARPGTPARGGVSPPAAAGARSPQRTVVEHPLTNDDFEVAFEVTALPFTARTNASGAGRQRGEPTECSATGQTLWYRYRAERNSGLFASTVGSAGLTSVGVFRGERIGDLQTVGCHTDAGGDALVPFAARRGVTYHFQVVRPLGGPVVFNLDPAGVTEMASVLTAGRPIPGASGGASISRNGRYVAFHSVPNVDDDTNVCDEQPSSLVTHTEFGTCPDVFVRDRTTRKTELISRSSSGAQGDDQSALPSISADGRYVSFTSWSTNLVRRDTNGWPDMFVRDRVTRKTERISVSSSERQGTPAAPAVDPGQPFLVNSDVAYEYSGYNLNNDSAISADGRFVAFATRMNGLVPNDTNSDYDVFLRDRVTGKTEIASVRPDGTPASDDSILVAISADGRYVVFDSESHDITIPNDTRRCGHLRCVDVFVYDRITREVEKISRSMNGGEGNDHSSFPTISADGRYVAFFSNASNLVPGDVEGTEDVFLHDRRTDKTTRVSVSSDEDAQVGETEPLTVILPAADPEVPRPVVSNDGSRVAFSSVAPNLVPRDTNNASDVFVRDVPTGTTVRVSVSTAGDQGNDDSYNASLSGDGRTIAFTSQSSNFVANDRNSCPDSDPAASCVDVFTHELPLIR